MTTFVDTIQQLRENPSIRKKLLWTIGLLALYRFLVFLPVPFADIQVLHTATTQGGGGLEYFAILL